MKTKVMPKVIRLVMICSAALIFLTFPGCAVQSDKMKNEQPVMAFKPVEVKALEPGLSVRYYKRKFRHINQMPTGEDELTQGVAGKPILYINHRFGSKGVFDSRRNQKVGVRLAGFLHFDQPGVYRLRTVSNDGVEVYLHGTVVVSDPGIHTAQQKISGPIKIKRKGWYPLKIKYFQNKKSAVLRLFWQHPKSERFEAVPPEAYGHKA